MKTSRSYSRLRLFSRQDGMSRFDLTITIVLVAVMVTTLISWWNHVRCGGWNEERLEEVAGRMVAMTQFAALGGVELVDPTDLDATIQNIAEGASPRTGPFAGQCYYGVRELDSIGRKRVKAYLRLDGHQLVLVNESRSS